MDGSLALHQGILYVGRHAKTARVRSFDLDGHGLETHFEFRDEVTGRSSVHGLAVDEDHRVWIADGAGGALRGFTLFGREIANVPGEGEHRADRRGSLGTPVDVLSWGSDEEQRLLVASAGQRRHAVQELHPTSGYQQSLRPLGDPEGRFQGVVDLAQHEDHLWVCERRKARIQIFRGGGYHYSLTLPGDFPDGAYPSALAPVGDGRSVVAVAGTASALLLLDSAGRCQRVLAGDSADQGLEGDEGFVQDPCDVVLERGDSERDTRVAVLDRAAERLQIFTLDGVCYGAFPTLRGA